MISSERLTEILLVHALQVSIVAALVAILCRFFFHRRPYLSHALWALVILKCLTPPIIPSPASLCGWLVPWHSTVPAPVDIAIAHQPQKMRPLRLHIDRSDRIPLKPHDSIDLPGQTEAEASSLQPTANKSILTQPAKLISVLWAAGVGLLLLISVIRLSYFLKWLATKPSKEPADLNTFARDFAHQIGLRRTAKVTVIDAHFGPAVVGLVRPTIILPAWLVDSVSHQNVRLLVAHELMHARTGDLRWSLLQTLATCVCWFHPLAWYASRKLTLEAERRCDEATVATTRCNPAEYARALLAVLERKHQLRVAPSLPGARPVDITAQRLERIMHLGQGRHSVPTRWRVAVFALVACIVLPGARLTLAQQETEKSEPAARIAAHSQTETNAYQSETESHQIETREYNVKDIFELMIEGGIIDQPSESGLELITFLRQFSNTGETSASVELDQRLDSQASISEGVLKITASPTDHVRIEEQLSKLRHNGFKQICVTVKMIALNKDQLTDLYWEPGTTDSGPLLIELKNAPKLTRAFYSRLDAAKAKSFLENIQKHVRTNILSAPKVTMFNGTSAQISDIVQRPFVTDITESEINGAKLQQPVVEVFNEGTTIAMQPTLMEANKVLFKSMVLAEAIEEVRTFTYYNATRKESDASVPAAGTTVQIPEHKQVALQTEIELLLGESIVITGGVPSLLGENDTILATMFTCEIVVPSPVVEASQSPDELNGVDPVQREIADHLPETSQFRTSEPETWVLRVGDAVEKAPDIAPLQAAFRAMETELDVLGIVTYQIDDNHIEVEANEFELESDEGGMRLAAEHGRLVIDLVQQSYTFQAKNLTANVDSDLVKADQCEISASDMRLTGNIVINLKEGTTLVCDKLVIPYDPDGQLQIHGNGIVVLKKSDEEIEVVRGDKILFDRDKNTAVLVE